MVAKNDKMSCTLLHGLIFGPRRDKTWPRGYKAFFMLNSTEQESSTAHKKLKYR